MPQASRDATETIDSIEPEAANQLPVNDRVSGTFVTLLETEVKSPKTVRRSAVDVLLAASKLAKLGQEVTISDFLQRSELTHDSVGRVRFETEERRMGNRSGGVGEKPFV